MCAGCSAWLMRMMRRCRRDSRRRGCWCESPPPGVARDRLQALIERANHRSPVSTALQEAVPVELRIELRD